MKKKPRNEPIPATEEMALSTLAIHGRKLYAYQGPVAAPIVQTSTYRFSDSQDAIRYAQGDPSVYVYTRYHNPTVTEAEERLALMMRTEKALLFSSGMAAITSTILAAVSNGEELISTPALYGGTYRFFRDMLPQYGIRVRYVRSEALEDISKLASKKTRLVYFETPTNPTLSLVDIEKLVAEVRRAERRIGSRIMIMVDNTFATVLNQNPLAYGVDVILESGTKYLGGHTDLMAGVVAGPPNIFQPVQNQLKYHGGCADPFAAYLLLRSLKTFALRVERHNENAFELARFLEGMTNVSSVLYPGLPSYPQHALARKQMTGMGGKGYGGMVTVEVRGGVKSAVRVCDSLRVAVNAMSLGGAETLVSIPVYSSHINMSASELRRHGVSPGMIRVSVGLEEVEDLKRDFAQALRRI
jgi:cystathionine beta-lyase/cystathionine gamma-synthase